MNEEVQEIANLVIALESLVATMLGDLISAGALDRAEYIRLLQTSEDHARQSNHHAASMALYRRLRTALETGSV